MKKRSFKGIELNRTVGFEFEGYTRKFNDMTNAGIKYSIIKRDGSLYNAWASGNDRRIGVEVVSEPLSKLDMVDEILTDMKKYKWNSGRGSAGTHIHVDANDFTLEQKINMAIFISKIEKLMYMLVKPTRYMRRRESRNAYCHSMSKGWERILERAKERGIDINRYGTEHLGAFIFDVNQQERAQGNFGYRIPDTTRYQMVNIFATRVPTIEFRLFHGMSNALEAKKCALIAYHIVETVKNSTLEQLNFIADGLANADSAEDMVVKFAEAIALDFIPKINNNMMKDIVNRDIEDRKSQQGLAV